MSAAIFASYCLALRDVRRPGAPAAEVFTVSSLEPVPIDVAAASQVRATDLGFCHYAGDPGTRLLRQKAIELSCTRGVAAEIGLEGVQGPGVTAQDRQIAAGIDTLRYGMHQDAARLRNWGNPAGADTTYAQGTSASQSVTTFGLIPAHQQITPGQYHHVIIVHDYY